jgi:hypothetical protein
MAPAATPAQDHPQRVEDTAVVRDLLHNAWRSVEHRIVAAGIPQGATVQTMVTIAAEEFSRVYGPDLAAAYFGAISSAFRQHAAEGRGSTTAETELPASGTRRSVWSWRVPKLFPL